MANWKIRWLGSFIIGYQDLSLFLIMNKTDKPLPVTLFTIWQPRSYFYESIIPDL